MATSCVKYRWITFTSPFKLYPLWPRVTNTMIRSFTNILRCPPRVVLQYRTLKISGTRASWLPMKCIKTSIFSRNSMTWLMCLSIPLCCHCNWLWCNRTNSFCICSFPTLFHSHVSGFSTPQALRESWTKFHPFCSFTELSRNVRILIQLRIEPRHLTNAAFLSAWV